MMEGATRIAEPTVGTRAKRVFAEVRRTDEGYVINIPVIKGEFKIRHAKNAEDTIHAALDVDVYQDVTRFTNGEKPDFVRQGILLVVREILREDEIVQRNGNLKGYNLLLYDDRSVQPKEIEPLPGGLVGDFVAEKDIHYFS